MVYRIYLILIVMMAAGLEAAVAENSRYRVEVLVLTHIEHQQEPLETRRLQDFSAALDFLQPPQEPAEPAPETTPPTVEKANDPQEGEPGIEGESEAPDPWNVVTHVEEMGPEMAEAWRRLRLSASFRPLQYLSWEQGSTPPFAVLRLHDLESLLMEDPWAEQRLALEEGNSAVAAADAASAAQAGEADDEADALPDPIHYYRLDGTVSLIRTRFLHLSVVAEWREPVYDETLAAGEPAPAAGAEPRPSAFLVHRLEQSRPVRSGRMEYFDGPVLGVLAWVSDISDTVVEPAADGPLTLQP